MERVNLIPDDLALRGIERVFSFIDRHFFPLIVCTVLLMSVAMAGLAVSQQVMMWRYVRQIDQLEERRALLVAEQENAAVYLKQLEQTAQELVEQERWLQYRIQYLTSYQGPGEWASVLRGIKAALPRGIWLTELEGTRGGRLRIAGGAFQDTMVVQFMGRLKAQPQLANIEFNFTKQSAIGRTQITEFEITCQLVWSDEMV